MNKCDVCLECRIVDIHLKQGHSTHVCQRCQNRNNPMHFLKNNLHTVWYKVSKNGKFTRDKDSNKISHFERLVELTKLSTAEKCLIQRCANYVPSVHLSNRKFAFKWHCATFPQDISTMCNKLPLCKETLLVFI